MLTGPDSLESDMKPDILIPDIKIMSLYLHGMQCYLSLKSLCQTECKLQQMNK